MNDNIKSTVFSDNENLGDEIERPFRPSGVVALLLGVVSAGAVATMQMIVIPILAVVVACYALRPAKGANVQPAGRGLAVVGMCLALLFGSWGFGYFKVRESQLTSGSAVFAENWLNVLGEGKQEIAFELTRPRHQRQIQTMPLKTYYGFNNPETHQQFKDFMSRDAPQSVFDAKGKPKWQEDGVVSIYRLYDQDYVAIRMIDTTRTISQPIVVTICRSPWIEQDGTVDWDKPRQWHIRDIAFATTQ